MENEKAFETHPDIGPTDISPLLAGVQPTPTSPSNPVQLDEVDLLKYQLLGSKVSSAELKIAMYTRELQHAQIERAHQTHAAAQHLKHIADKYNVDFRLNMVTEDGYIVPRSLNHSNELKG